MAFRRRRPTAVKTVVTSPPRIFGAGPVIAGTVVGDVADVSRFASQDRFAAYNGTAPIEVSSGNRKVRRRSPHGNRRINHAVHMAAITQIRHRHSDGRAYYDRKVAEGKTHKEALRSLKRRISDAIYSRLQADARRAAAAACAKGPGGQPGNDSVAGVASYTPSAGSSAKPLPSPDQPHDPARRPREPCAPGRTKKPGRYLDNKEVSFCAGVGCSLVERLGAQIWIFCAPAVGGLPRAAAAPARTGRRSSPAA